MRETIVDLIRHGEPEGGRRYRGHSVDDPLSEKGWQQMWEAVGSEAPWQQIITSPLQRCRAFAESLATKHALPVTVENDLREVGFGSWEGRTPEEIIASAKQEYDDFYRDPIHNRPTGAEALEDFVGRVSRCYERIVEDNSGKHCLIVAHAGVNRAIIAHILGAPAVGMYRIKVDNAGISRLRHDDNGGRLDFHNGSLSGR